MKAGTKWGNSMKTIIKKWAKTDDGATAIEYGLMMAALALVIIASVFAFGEDMAAMFTTLSGWMDR
jgi:Flp pilus assembly pilin Flp